MKIFFLSARVPLIKCFVLENTGEISTTPYPLVSRFTSHEAEVADLADFYQQLQFHAIKGHCLLKGVLTRSLDNESRAGSTDPSEKTEWLLIDVDGITNSDILSILTKLGIVNTSHIIQYSSSMGVFPNKGLSAHVFVKLTKPIEPHIIKEWLIAQNINQFRADIKLNRLKESLHWPIDITTCQNDKLIYIAPPHCDPSELDKFQGPRIELVVQAKQTFDFPQFTPIPDSQILALKNKLRSDEGLPKSKSLKIDKSSRLLYSPNPQHAQVTGIKVGEEFTYLNLNGGDSWGYYHLTRRPEIIYNFKGEPNYKTSELLPEYWNSIIAEKRKAAAEKGIVLGIRDRRTSSYYTGYYNQADDRLIDVVKTAGREHVDDFYANNGLAIPDHIPDWNCFYNPNLDFTIDLPKLTVNWFQPSPYMQLIQSTQSTQSQPTKNKIPESTQKLLECVLGHDQVLTDYFCHWLACALRARRPTGTAWILQGVPGTGKGMLVNTILIPLFGKTNVAVKRMTELEDKFNEHLENTLLCFIDEISIGENRKHDAVLADLKQYITEPTITVRKMRQAAYEVNNYTNWIFSTNNKTPVKIEQGDRRYNVGNYMREPLRKVIGNTYDFVKKLQKELPDFANYLHGIELDLNKASVVFDNEARRSMIAASMTTIDMLAKALNEGDLETLYEFVEDHTKIMDPVRSILVKAYSDLIKELVLTQRGYLLRDELAIICDCMIGQNIPKGAAKFTKFLAHHDIDIKVIRAGDKTARGIKVNWQCNDEWLKSTQADLSSNKVTPMKKVI